MKVVGVDEAGRVAGITVFRVVEKTFSGRELYCDDLITDKFYFREGMTVGAFHFTRKVK